MATPTSPPSLVQTPPSSKKNSWVSSFPSQIFHPTLQLFLFLTALSPSLISSSSPAKNSYADHCNSIVPQSIPSGLSFDSYSSIQLSNGYFSGGDNLLSPDPDLSSSKFTLPGYFYFYTRSFYQTRTPGVIQLDGYLSFQGGRTRHARTNSRRRAGHQAFVSFNAWKMVDFHLSGFWSKSTGKLCMVGSGSTTSTQGTPLQLSAVFKLDYPAHSNISTSLVGGTVESLDTAASPNHFDPISILAYVQNNYSYTKIPQVIDSCTHVNVPTELLGFDVSATCNYLQNMLMGRFRLEYGSDCSGRDCGPFSNKKSLGFSPTFMTFSQIQCAEDGRVHLYIRFYNDSSYDYNNILVLEKSLVSEGFWDREKNRLCLLACPIQNTKDSLVDVSVGDCSVGFSLWFPAVLSMKNRSNILGRIWSNKDKSDSSYFSMVSFRSLETNRGILSGQRYDYTEIDSVRRYCENNKVIKLGNKRYPDGNFIGDMRFDLSVRNGESKTTWGYANPLSFGETFYANSYSVATIATVPVTKLVEMNYNLWNVSYQISYTFFNSSLEVNEWTEISAEGIYNAGTGMLCMVGCRDLSSSDLSKKVKAEDSMDCEILINIQLSPLNPDDGEHINGTIRSTRHLNGTIRSTRKKLDPLYFEPLELSSRNMYRKQAFESIWRMDIEITMVLISLTLLCIFIGLQIFHIKKNPDVLPTISITMLVILTLGHMIPLVLNFEALFFRKQNRQNVLLWSGGWLEVNEVIVRVMTMVAFLLQFRLLQLAWTARFSDEGKRGLWVAERKALRLCLPLYFSGALIAWFVHSRSYQTQPKSLDYGAEHDHSIWEDLISYAGLVLDGFLLPQIILNIFWNSKDKALAPLFYIGTTAVRALPHLYDAYRARYYVPYFNSSYIYASPDGDFYSSAWDIIIPLEVVLFAVLIFLQQRFGGSCLLPQRFRKPGGYETVSVVSV